MGKMLIVAEKPDVARKIGAALGVSGAENSQFVLTASAGHAVEIYAEGDDDRTIVPFLPEKFKLRPIKGRNDLFDRVARAIRRPDVDVVINACDAGREGEAIFRLIYDHSRAPKPVERMWVKSMTPGGLREAFEHRKPASVYNGLADAARCRMEADLLYGYNGSRAARDPVGRVMTPALAIVVDRWRAHTQFKSETFYEIVAKFAGSGGDWTARWTRETALKESAGEEKARGAKEADEEDAEAEVGSRFKSRADAEKILAACRGRHPSETQETSRAVQSRPPLLFNLSSLQIEASAKLGMSADATLAAAQRLYEAGVTTYPRTSSRYLTQDYGGAAQAALKALSAVPTYGPLVAQTRVDPRNRAVFDDSKVTDHFAIVPTGEGVDAAGADQAIYEMICRRFMAVFMPSAEYLAVQRLSTIVGADGQKHRFHASARRLVKAGWTAAERPGKTGAELPALKPGEHGQTREMNVHEGVTKPPPLLTEGMLIKLMTTAGKMVDDEEAAAAMAENGIGTEATRAAVIKKLQTPPKSAPGAPKRDPYLRVEKKKLIPTERAIRLIDYVRAQFPALVSPEMTGQWEKRLAMIERGQDSRDAFMRDARNETKAMAEKMKANPPARAGGSIGSSMGGGASRAAPKVGAPCPVCGKPTTDLAFKIVCDGGKPNGGGCGFNIWRKVAGRDMSEQEIAAFMQQGRVGPLKNFISKAGKPFSASLVWNDASKRTDFEFEDRR